MHKKGIEQLSDAFMRAVWHFMLLMCLGVESAAPNFNPPLRPEGSPVDDPSPRTLPSSSSSTDGNRVAFVVLAVGPWYPLIGSLIERYSKAFASFPSVDVMVALSCPNLTYTARQCEEMTAKWQASTLAASVTLITTDQIGINFPQLAPILPEMGGVKPFEWAHHEPTILSRTRIASRAPT